MNLIIVESLSLDELRIYNELRDNAFRDDNSFIADSPKVVNLLLESAIEVKSILATQEYYNEFKELIEKRNIPKLYVADKALMSKVVGHKIHHNCMMHGIRPADVSLDDLGESVILLDSITSAENVGSIARSAAALGVDSYLMGKESPHPFNRRALRVSMGHAHLLDIHIYDDIIKSIKELKQRGYRIYAAEVTPNATPLAQVKITQKWVLVMGHEGFGIAQEILDVCDEVVTIEMVEGIKSFNVAVAASLMMYRFKML